MKSAFLFCLIASFCSLVVEAQDIPKLDGSPLDLAEFRPNGKKSQPIARIIYSRPQKKERAIFGKLVPFGKVWRTGANQATEFNVYKDMTLEGKKVPAGNYTLYTIPGEKEWTVIINAERHTWGAYSYDESKDVARVKVPVTISKKSHEAFGIAFDGKDGKGKFLMAWDTTEVYVNFTY